MSDALAGLVREIEEHVAEGGWDQPARLFALVPTHELVEREPRLAAVLGVGTGLEEGGITPVEQEELPEYATLEELLAGIAWPDGVVGAALAVERVMLPPAVEDELPDDEREALRVLADHPRRQEVRLAVGVLRDGSRACALRFRAADEAGDAAGGGEVVTGPDLVPTLVDALAATLQP